jgi:transposase
MSRQHKDGLEAPEGLIIESIEVCDGRVTVVARSVLRSSACPECGAVSGSAHSRYVRRLADLPSQGSAGRLLLRTRRFRCRSIGCPVKFFAERFDPSVRAAIWEADGASKGDCSSYWPRPWWQAGPSDSEATSCRSAALRCLRVVRRRSPATDALPRVVGIDDWGWRKGHRYGTVVCDLERRRIIDVLPDPETATALAWLVARPSTRIIARDRGGGYGPAGAGVRTPCRSQTVGILWIVVRPCWALSGTPCETSAGLWGQGHLARRS